VTKSKEVFWEIPKMFTKFMSEVLKGRDQLGDVVEDVRIILK
jgi:hypothetical protein